MQATERREGSPWDNDLQKEQSKMPDSASDATSVSLGGPPTVC